MDAAKTNRQGLRDATMILMAWRHALAGGRAIAAQTLAELRF
jgi:hypothetical protein